MVAVLGVVATLAMAGRARAFCQTTTLTKISGSDCVTSGTPLRWERQCITFTVGSSDPDVRTAIDRAFAAWTEVDCGGQPVGLAVRQTEDTAICTLAEYNPDAPNMNAILVVPDWAERAELPEDAFAITTVSSLPGGEIVDADLLLNPTLGNLTICDDECANRRDDIDIQDVVAHEAGHFLGLAHSDIDGATMSPTAPVGETTKRDLADDDVAGLCAIYGGLPPASCSDRDFVPRHGFSVNCGEPPSSGGGCSLRSTHLARPPSLPAWIAALAFGAGGVLRARRRRQSARAWRLSAARAGPFALGPVRRALGLVIVIAVAGPLSRRLNAQRGLRS